MPKVSAPLLSFGASGQIGNAQVYSSWKGIPYARRYVIPSNPKTTKQESNRALWRLINAAWLYAPAQIKQAFEAYAVGKQLTARNKFFSDNQKLFGVYPKADSLVGFVVSPGNGGGLPPTGLEVEAGNGQLTASVVLPEVPEGWTLVKSVAVAIADQSPEAEFSGKWFVATNAVAPASVVIPGLESATDYVVGFFLEWLKPDGKTAYSVSLSSSGTTTA